ncbi:hypothetical protein HRI_000119200 [Hibiscus trionum]|uniref:Reverse transcriptase domain-containing protein n=1 Tax=Hibiscus trionum TaxID=183268 RepID=A0A9W7GT86_HIBTR|nr:hypothetical protein HRI_000119200 [Hibiscus trionum]
MEMLGHDINYALELCLWQPIVLSRGGPTLSHLFFADNLVLFGEPTLDQENLVRAILDQFSRFSGHRVNSSKTQIFFYSNVINDLAKSISGALRFQCWLDLGMYLGRL